MKFISDNSLMIASSFLDVWFLLRLGRFSYFMRQLPLSCGSFILDMCVTTSMVWWKKWKMSFASRSKSNILFNILCGNCSIYCVGTHFLKKHKAWGDFYVQVWFWTLRKICSLLYTSGILYFLLHSWGITCAFIVINDFLFTCKKSIWIPLPIFNDLHSNFNYR